MEYVIIDASDIYFLIDKVNGCIKSGWRPLGSIAIKPITVPEHGSTIFYQAMIRRTRIVGPNHKMGYTKTYLKKELESVGVSWEGFIQFMRGQTCGFHDKEPVYYKHDVERFLDRELIPYTY